MGEFAFLIFTVGIIGIGLQAVPVLSGAVAYALSELLGQKEGLGKTLSEAKFFYLVLGLATGIGAIAIIIKLADDSRVVGSFKTSKVNRIIAWVSLIFVGLASTLMIVNSIR